MSGVDGKKSGGVGAAKRLWGELRSLENAAGWARSALKAGRKDSSVVAKRENGGAGFDHPGVP